MKGTLVFERDDRLYLVAPVAPFDLSETELEELAFAEDLRKIAPNEHLYWLRGQYVEADKPNRNGQMWTAGELEIASLTPNLMPVTVMHDPRTAVGLIADTKLLLAETAGLPRSRIDATLAVWRHRFPEIAEEAAANYEQGTLMQSMECLPRWYECLDCGQRFPKLPGGAERASWCAHLEEKAIAGSAANTTAARRLGQVTFTGTGLIFGTRGAVGAFDEAHLDSLQDEVAEFHERAKIDTRPKAKPRRTTKMEIEDSRYQELLAAESRVKELEPRLTSAEEQAAKVPELETNLEKTETEKVAAEKERDDLKTKVDTAEEEARAATLSKDRLGKLGKGFTEKLGEFTRGRLEEQAGKLSEEDWDARLKELEETAGVKRDEGGPANDGKQGDELTAEETARSQLGNGAGRSGGTGGEPTAAERRSVVGGLVRK